MSKEEELAYALFNAGRLEENSGGVGTTTTMYGDAVSDSSNGYVKVTLDGDVSATYADGSVGSNVLNLPTVPNVVKGDKVIIQCVGTTAKTMTVIGVVGSGDRTHILAVDADAESAKAREEAKEAVAGAQEAQKQLDAYVEQAKKETEELQKECDAAQKAADAAQAEAEAQTAKIQALVEDGEKKQAQIDANTAQAAIDQERTNCNNDMYQTSAKNIIDVMGNQGSLKASTGQLIFTASSAQPTASHTGDLWLDTASNAACKWDGSAWVALDGETAKDDTAKLVAAANVEGSPFRVFTVQPTTPYKVGDLYLTDVDKGDIYRCIKAREEGDYSADDWSVTSSYDSAMSQLMRALDAGKASLETKAAELKAKADNAFAEADALGQVATNNYQVEYIQTDSATTAPSQDASGWSTTAPTRAEGKYIWMRSTYYIGTGDHAQLTHSEPSCVTGDAGKDGTNGTNGKDGTNGVSVTASDTFYILATSQPATPTGAADPSGWSKTEPTPADTYTGNEYRCIRTTLSNGNALWTTPTVVASFSFAQKAYQTATGAVAKYSSTKDTVDSWVKSFGEDFSAITGEGWKAGTTLAQTAKDITLKADSSYVEQVGVGGRNLLRYTNRYDFTGEYDAPTFGLGTTGAATTLRTAYLDGETYYLSPRSVYTSWAESKFVDGTDSWTGTDYTGYGWAVGDKVLWRFKASDTGKCMYEVMTITEISSSKVTGTTTFSDMAGATWGWRVRVTKAPSSWHYFYARDSYGTMKGICDDGAEYYTVSCRMKASVATSDNPLQNLGIANGTSSNRAYSPVDSTGRLTAGKWCFVSGTVKRIEGASYSSQVIYFTYPALAAAGVTLEVKDLKIERGRQATDWTSAPEDGDLVTSAQIKVESDRITEEVKGTYATKGGLSTLTNTVTSLDTSTTRRFEAVYSNCTGRNYAVSTNRRGCSNDWGEWFTPGTNADNKCTTYGRFCVPSGLTEDDSVTVSFEVEFSGVSAGSGGPFAVYTQGATDGSWSYGNPVNSVMRLYSAPADGVQKFSKTVSCKGTSWYDKSRCNLEVRCDYWGGGKLRFRRIKIEKGTEATPFSEAPESTLIHQTSDGVAVGKGTQATDGTVTWTSGQFHTLQGNGTFQVQDAGGTAYTTIGAGTATIGNANGYNTNITSDALQLRKGSTTLAQVSGSTATIGQSSGLNTYIDGNGIYMRNGTGTTLAKWNASSLLLGQTSGSYPYNLYATGSGLYLRNGETNLASMQSNGVTVGAESGVHTVMSTSGMNIKDGSGNSRACYSAAAARLGLESGLHSTFTESWLSFYNGTDEIGWFGPSSAQIGSSSTSSTLQGYNTRIDAEGAKIRYGTSNRLKATSSGLYIYDSGGTQYTAVESGKATLGNPASYNTVVDANGMTINSGSTERASFTSSEVSLGAGALQITGSGTTSYLKQKGVFSGGIMELYAMNGINLNGVANVPAMTVTPATSYQRTLSSSLRMVNCSVTKGSVLSRMTRTSTSYGGVTGYGIGTSTFNAPFSPKVSGFATFEGVSSGTNCILGIVDNSTLVAYGIATAAGGFCTVSISPIVVPSSTSHVFKLVARTGNATGYIGSNSGEDNLKAALTVTF